ncbi:MAG: hypothetical protein AAF494_00680 [Pseudomonadota bacterium]
MTFEGVDVFDWLLGAVIAVVSAMWTMLRGERKAAKEDHSKLAERVSQIELTVAGNYVPREEYNENFRELKRSLERIEEKLGSKADKD